MEHHQPRGFVSRPLPGSTGRALSVGGAAWHPVLINAFHPEKAPKGVAEGEVGLYHHQGQPLPGIKAKETPSSCGWPPRRG